MKKIQIIFAFILFFLLRTQSAYAATCQPLYGGGVSCTKSTLTVDKEIQNPQTGEYVDKLGPNDPHFSPNQTVIFHLTVKNSGGTKISTIQLTDVFPEYVTYVSGNGNYNSANRTLTLSIPTLQSKESKTFTVQGKINAMSDLPQQKLLCVSNLAKVATRTLTNRDTVNLCIENTNTGSGTPSPSQSNTTNPQRAPTTSSHLPIYPQPNNKKSPSTGPETISLIGLIPVAIAGWKLRKITKI